MRKAIYVEPDHDLAISVILNLKTINIHVTYFNTGNEALNEFERTFPDLILLDLNLSGNLSGFDIARIIRSKSQVPILFSTFIMNKAEMKKLLGISNSDYILKPFHLDEFQLRVQKMLAHVVVRSEIWLGSLRYSPSEQLLTNGAEIIRLGNSENNVLSLLCEHRGFFVGKDLICKRIWGEDDFRLRDQTLLNCISKLRKMLKSDPSVLIESNMKLKLRIVVYERR